MKEIMEVERICLNCGHFFSSCPSEISNMGVCVLDEEFEPFLDDLVDADGNLSCPELVRKKEYDGDREACPQYEETEIMEGAEELGREIQGCIHDGKVDMEKLENVLLMKQIENIDWKSVPVEPYVKKLGSPDKEEQKSALSSLHGLASWGNQEAYKELIEYFKSLPPALTLEDVHFKIHLLSKLRRPGEDADLVPVLIKELYDIPSNNTTRQWISAIFDFLKMAPLEMVREPMKEMLKEKRFTYRIKQKIQNILEEDEGLSQGRGTGDFWGIWE